MGDEVSIPMSLPLDEDGFIRRECPTCEREFKCLVSHDDEEATPAPVGGYYCPYCAVQAPPDSWWTKDQIEKATALLYAEAVEPELEKLKRSIDGLNRSGGFISGKLEVSDTPEEPQLDEVAEDMRRVDFACHPDDPVKVLMMWDRPVHCVICGSASS